MKTESRIVDQILEEAPSKQDFAEHVDQLVRQKFAIIPAGLQSALDALFAAPAPAFLIWGPDNLFFSNRLLPLFAQVAQATPFPLERAERMRSTLEPEVFSAAELSNLPSADEAQVQALPLLFRKAYNGILCQLQFLKGSARLEHILDEAPIGIAVLRGNDFVVEMANKSYLQLIDRAREAFVGKPLFVGLPEVQKDVEPLLRGVLETGTPYTASDFRITINRAEREAVAYFDFVYHPLRNTDGAVDGVMVIVAEVTESVLSRHRISESEKQFRHMVMQSPIPMTIFKGEDFIIEMANKVMFNDIWRRSEEEVLGKPLLEVFPELQDQKYMDLLRNVLRSGLPHQEKESIAFVAGADGMRKFYLDFEYAPLSAPDGSIFAIIVTVNDVTEKVLAREAIAQSENRFRNLADSAPVMIWMADQDMMLTYANKARIKFRGTPIEEETGAGWIKGIHPEDRERCIGQLREAYAERKIFALEFRLLRHDGEHRWVSTTGVPRYGAEENFEGYIGACIDVHDNVIYNRELRENEARRDIVMDAAELGMWELNLNTHKVSYSKKYKEIFELNTDKELAHAEMVARIYGPDLPARKTAIDRAFKTGSLFYRLRIVGLNGDLRWIETRGKLLYGDDGKPEKMIGTVRDVTEESNYRENLLAREQKFRSLADALPQIIWTTDATGRPDYFNEVFYVFAGAKPDDLLYNEEYWKHAVFSPDRELFRSAWQQAIEGEGEVNFEHRLMSASGVLRWFHTKAVAQRDAEGDISTWIFTTSDIQEHKLFEQELRLQVEQRTADLKKLNEALIESEERYHLMISEVQEYAIIYLNTEGIIENWNKGAEKIKGYKEREVVGKSFEIFYPEKERTEGLPARLLNEARTNGNAQHEGRRVRKDGTLFWAHVLITALHDEYGKVIGFSKVTHDLSDRKKADDRIKLQADELRQKNEELEKMNKELESFAYISSHDLQEPLRKIRIFAGRIIDKELQNLSEKGKEYFERMQESAGRMQTLIQDLLVYSRTNNTDKSFELTDLNELLDQVKADLKETLAENKAVITSEGLCTFNAIRFQMSQVFYNLIGNAIKFSREGVPPHLHIKGESVYGFETDIPSLQANARYCKLTFEDNGIGFDQEFSERIFEVFQRLHDKDTYSGTGIGLAIVKKIVNNHRGFIRARGCLDKGAVFEMFFPMN